jgi:hypothetical protein
MLLVGDRCTNSAKSAVPGRLHDVAVVAMNCVNHKPERRVTIARASSGSRSAISSIALDVGEQRRDGLALAFGNLADARRAFR